jgi:transcriptional regulator with XRE-family HTH domain
LLVDKIEQIEETKKQAGSLLRQHRTAAGVSQTEFAKSLGVSQAYVSQVENGHKTPTTSMLREAIEILDPERGSDGNAKQKQEDVRKKRSGKGIPKGGRKRS